MNRKILFSISLILSCICRMGAQSDNVSFEIEDVRYNDNISFPFIISMAPEKVEVANRINKRLQNVLFNDDEIINKSNLQSIEKYLFSQNDSDNQVGIRSLNYTCNFYPNFLSVSISLDWESSWYPFETERYCLYFDLEKGELILMPDLIDGAKYFDFLEIFWLNECRNSIKEAHQCAYGNETDDYESGSAYTLEGECEYQCHKMNHQFIITEDDLFISNDANCFPRILQFCNSGSAKNLKISEIKEFLSDYGKWLLGYSNTYRDVTPYFHFVGKIDNKYKISLSICKSKEDDVNGAYFYWRQNEKVLLKGQIQSDSEQIVMDEFVDNAKTGSFELEWDDFLYSTVGFWYNKAKDKKLTVHLLNIYDYRSRCYYR